VVTFKNTHHAVTDGCSLVSNTSLTTDASCDISIGYHVLAANSPAEALSLVEVHQGEIHLLLTNVVMPGMNGRDLAKEIKKAHPEIKALFMSGYTANVIAHHGVLDEGINFIQKPFTRSDLSMRIREALDS
jgi:two-component system cell cycle sensor histidine kinase/response regulator CckA